MAVTLSTRNRWAISRDNATSWGDFPRGPNSIKVNQSVEPLQYLDGTQLVSEYWDFELTFTLLTPAELTEFQRLYDPNNQKILLNYYSGARAGNGATGGTDTSWVYAPAVWSQPIAVGINEIRGMLAFNIALRFTNVQWDGVTRYGGGIT